MSADTILTNKHIRKVTLGFLRAKKWAVAYSISRLKARPGQKLEFQPKTPPPLKTHKMAHEQDMKAALAELEASSKPNYTKIAEKYKLGRYALSRRHQGKTTS
jgi:hypothetical protein